jgi:hypothetical protein
MSAETSLGRKCGLASGGAHAPPLAWSAKGDSLTSLVNQDDEFE